MVGAFSDMCTHVFNRLKERCAVHLFPFPFAFLFLFIFLFLFLPLPVPVPLLSACVNNAVRLRVAFSHYRSEQTRVERLRRMESRRTELQQQLGAS